jgi:hypothetical protein
MFETMSVGRDNDRDRKGTDNPLTELASTMDLGKSVKPRATRPERGASWKDGYKGMNASLQRSLTGPYAVQSRRALVEEIKNMISYHVGSYTNYYDIPRAQRKYILRSFMFLKMKSKPDGSFDKIKARLVADGKHQDESLYDLIASAMVSLKGVFLLFNIASYYGAILASIDITGAFLNAGFTAQDPTVHVMIDHVTAAQWAEIDPTCIPFLTHKGELILTLDKFLYGLKQSPLKFQLHLALALKTGGYRQLLNDECMFIKRTREGFCLLSTHVDDILVVSTSQVLVDQLVAHLIATYKRITFHQVADSYLGMTITRSTDLRELTITQQGLTTKIINSYLNPDSSSSRTPANTDLFGYDSSLSPSYDKKRYLSMVMSLMYLARLTRPDILLATTFLASRSQSPTIEDWKRGERIMKYLSGTRSYGVKINCQDLQLHAYCDASYGSHIDGRSHSGYVISLGKSLSYLSARSCKQTSASLSSTDAELIASVSCIRDIGMLSELISELDLTRLEPSILYQDNQSIIVLITRKAKFKRTKHLLSQLLFARDAVDNGSLLVKWIKTEDMHADALTKPMPVAAHRRHIARMGVTDLDGP